MSHTVFRTCTLCEAMCGLAFEVEENRILAVRADDADVFSQGYICPKGVAIASIHDDPDRLRQPMRRTATGAFEPICVGRCDVAGCASACATSARATGATRSRSITATRWCTTTARSHCAKGSSTPSARATAPAPARRTPARASPTSYYLYGSSWAIPVPDVERTDYLLCIGANPIVSHGSFLCAPNMRARLRAIRQRGGKVVVVDPRRSETAREADEHVAIRPGGDAALLLAMVRVLLERGRVDRERGRPHRARLGGDRAPRRSPSRSRARRTLSGVAAETIERLALEFADAPRAVAYSRVGVCNNAFGTLATLATDLLNLAAGRLGAVGGVDVHRARPSTSPISRASPASTDTTAGAAACAACPRRSAICPPRCWPRRWRRRARDRSARLVTFAGNPVLSTPNGRRLAAAIEQLDFMVSIDLYVNETTRHAD